MAVEADYAIVGGGLQAGLIALAVRARQPTARIALVERASHLGGNHTWCFHAEDLPADSTWIEPLIAVRWDRYDVAFPNRRRTLASPYACVTSARLDHTVRPAIDHLVLGEPAIAIEEHRVITRDDEIHATVVIDARGPAHLPPAQAGWQLFVGHELRVLDHGVERPLLIDATVPQVGGFRFVYVLPLDRDRLLVEDTLYADTPVLDLGAGRAAIAAYVTARGWAVEEVLREETGVLPLPLRYAIARPERSPLVAGYAGGWFHPVTGYSFPIAARLASAIASVPATELFGDGLARFAAAHEEQLDFACRLNRMLFRWFAPERRYHVLEHFYRLPEDVIGRFYALELTALDRARMFVGAPPRGMSWRAALSSWRLA